MVSQAKTLEITQEAVTEEERILKDEAERLSEAFRLLMNKKPALLMTNQGAETLLERASKDLYGQGDNGVAGMSVIIQNIRTDANQARINIGKAIVQLSEGIADGHRIVALARNIRSISSGMQAAEREAAKEALTYDQALGRRVTELRKIDTDLDQIFNLHPNQMLMMRRIAEKNSVLLRAEASFINNYRNHMVNLFNIIKKTSGKKRGLFRIFG